MADREKLIEFLDSVQQKGVVYTPSQMDDRYGTTREILNAEVADRLIATGVKIPVLCEECKHRAIGDNVCIHPNRIGDGYIEVRDNDFCSYGERRT